MTLRLPTWALPTALAALLLAGWWALAEHDAKVRAEARAEVERARLDSLAAVLEAQRETVRRSDLETAAAREELALVRAEGERLLEAARAETGAAEVRAADAGRTLDATLDSLLASVPPPLVPTVRDAQAQLQTERQAHGAIAAGYRAQIDAQAVMLASADSSLSLAGSQIRVRDDLIAGLEESLAGERALRESYRRLADPPWHVSARRALPWALGTAAVAVIAWEVAR